jgi:tRNA(Ile)-lysidine synthase
LYDRFQTHIDQSFPFLKEKKLLLAFSGGVDSVVLCDLFDQMNLNFALAHCNFKLRGEASDQDETFVKQEALKRNKVVYTVSFATKDYAQQHKLSIQMAARALRYEWFKKILFENEFDYLITAHHADDSLETFFINLSRGTGLKGLTGIPENQKRVLRPLLPFTKKEIKTFGMEKGLMWREDKSNEDTKYLRNKIRKELVPVLKELNPSFMTSFSNTLYNLQGNIEIINDRMDAVLKDVIKPSVNEDSEEVTFKVEQLMTYASNTAYLYQIFHPYGFDQWEDIQSLLKAQSGKQLLSKTHRLVKNRKDLILSPIAKKTTFSPSYEITEDQKSLRLEKMAINFQHYKISDQFKIDQKLLTAEFDKDLIRFPLLVRKWKKGDYFYPLGMGGKKKLSDFFKDEKYSLLQKENIWLLCSGEDIIWLIGKRMDNRYKVTDKTKNILKATIRS